MTAPRSIFCVCAHPARLHPTGLECDACTCERYVCEDDICATCMGAGILGNVRDTWFDGRRCPDCAGVGWVEPGRDEAAHAEVEAELAAEADCDLNS